MLFPAGETTRTSTKPEPRGLRTRHVVAVGHVTRVPADEPKVIDVTFTRFLPVIVTWVPPPFGPDVGLIEVIIGAAGAGGGPTGGTAIPLPDMVSSVGFPTASSIVRVPPAGAAAVGVKATSMVQVDPATNGIVVAAEHVPPVHRNAGSVDGVKIREALENLKTPYEGYAKTYNHPFSRTEHEGLTAADQRWTCWRNGKLAAFKDATIEGLRPEDFKG